MRHYCFQSVIGAIATIVGFLCQFLGLLALHWMVTAAMLLGATLLIIPVRIWASRELAGRLTWDAIPEGQDEQTYLTLDLIMKLHGWELKCGVIEYCGHNRNRPIGHHPVLSYASEMLAAGS